MGFRSIISAVLIFGTAFVVWNYLKPEQILPACAEAITYNISAFDRRFGVSYQTFLNALAEAEAIWEKPMGKELFVYEPESGELAVNLIYDYRQETTGTLSGLENIVAKDELAYQAMRAKYINLKTEYGGAKSVYDTRIEVFDERNAAYQKQVEFWNKGKRTSREQFNQLEAERVELEKEMAELKILETQLNEMVREINKLVGSLNRLIKSLNLNVGAYNTIGASRGETFVGGIYHSAEGVREINVYEFSNRDKLVRVLAHEFGHALGLEHVEDRNAMMYKLNEGDARVLSKSDLVALKALCKIE
ncbi:MAG: Peptidase M10A and M12B matrixin and adamalysin [Parcubacteria group bacterium GW2011_GWC1_43_30]|nr:MAG: Peptidase M10A and M12B matrixin and adamalysin [Parcubacteria group bacterium GW2011_GWC1_43_30]